jgi:uncharacterized hydrophobic protein (TIGR00271 family)
VLQVRVYVPGAAAESVAGELQRISGVTHVVRGGETEAGDQLITADVTPDSADAALHALRNRAGPEDITLLRIESVSPADVTLRRRWLGRDPSAASWPEVIEEARGNARLFARFLALMSAAGVIAAVGVDGRNAILIIGAMAISPDLLPLSASCVAIVTRRPRLLARSIATLAIGLLAVATFASATAYLLDVLDVYTGDLGTGGLGDLTTTDPSTIMIALAAGVAGMLAVETRAGAAVGVAISVTTIPAAAYVGVATQSSQSGDALGALGVLGTNLLCVLIAGTLTLLAQRGMRILRTTGAPRA